MKLSELKHNHSLTDLLKILLFAILMLAPIGMVASRCLYVIVNKNAYQSYYGETINEVIMENVDTFNTNDKYEFNAAQIQNLTTNRQDLFVNNLKIISAATSSLITNVNNANINQIFFANSGTANSYVAFTNGINTYYCNLKTESVSFEFYYTSGNITDTWLLNLFKEYTYNKNSYLDNVFEYSVSQIEESTLFNWTQNTAIFSGVQTMTTQLGITNQTIPILLVYWFLLTVIYIIIDIILKLFTYMTHAIGSRKA